MQRTVFLNAPPPMNYLVQNVNVTKTENHAITLEYVINYSFPLYLHLHRRAWHRSMLGIFLYSAPYFFRQGCLLTESGGQGFA